MRTKLHTLSLSLSFLLLALSKHSLGEYVRSPQYIAVAILVSCYLISIFSNGFIRGSGLVITIASSAVTIIAFWIGGFSNIPNVANSVLIFTTFPLVTQIAALLVDEKAWNFTTYSAVAVIALVIIGGFTVGWDVSYLGDSRGSRLVAGWTKPTFLAEAAILLIFMAVARRSELGTSLLGVRTKPMFYLIIVVLLALIMATGSRAALGATTIFLYWHWQETRTSQLRRALRLILNISVVLVALGFARYGADLDALTLDVLNTRSSGRAFMFIIESETHLSTTSKWLLGNYDAYMVFLRRDFGDGIVYHIDSFFGERLIVTGGLGLTLVMFSIWKSVV